MKTVSLGFFCFFEYTDFMQKRTAEAGHVQLHLQWKMNVARRKVSVLSGFCALTSMQTWKFDTYVFRDQTMRERLLQ